MSEFLIALVLGMGLSATITYLIHRYSLKQLEGAAKKGLEELCKHAKDSISEMAESVREFFKNNTLSK